MGGFNFMNAIVLLLTFAALCLAQNYSYSYSPWCLSPNLRNKACSQNDTVCGIWEGRSYCPIGCKYKSFTVDEATKCLANRTIACVGDSILRDMCHGLGTMLEGYEVSQAPDIKFDKLSSPFEYAARVSTFKSWKVNRDGYNSLVYPKAGVNASWQVQGWILRDSHFLADNHMEDVLSGKLIAEEPLLHNISLAFWGYGLHETELWGTPPYGEMYFEHFVSKWLTLRNEVSVPLVWTSINEHCAALDPTKKVRHGTFTRQEEMVRQANLYTRTTLRAMKLPYYDFAAPLRTPQICEISADGLHVKMWVDLVRAQILLNHLCDENNNWVGGAEAFV